MKKVLLIILIALGLKAEPSTMLPSTFQLLENAQDMMGEKRYDEAAAKLEEAAKTLEKRPYDLAFVLHTRAYVALATDRYGEAKSYFERAIALKTLPENTHLGTLIALAQIELIEHRPDAAIMILKRWEKEAKNPAPQGFLLLASAYLEKNDYLAAYEPLKKAIALSAEPPLSWQRTLGGVCLELEKFDEAIGVYKKAVAYAGSGRADWMGLFYAYAAKGREKEALSALTAALEAKALEGENDLFLLARLQLNGGVPMRAARLIESAIAENKVAKKAESYELIAYGFRLAREHNKALWALGTGAALEGGERLYEPLAHAALEAGRYEEAIEAAKKAIGHKPKNPGALWLLSGAAAYEIKDYKTARSAFEKAAGFEKSKNQADRWLSYLKTSAL